MTQTSIDDAAIDDVGMLDEAWLASPTKRSRSRVVMLGLLVAAMCFLGGSLTQKYFGADDSPSAAQSVPGGFPAGLPEGFAGGGAANLPAPSGGGTAPVDEDPSDSVIGTVIEINGDVWVVEDLGGKQHQVKVVEDTTVTRETRITTEDINTGDRVQVTGTTKAKELQADSVTQR